MLEALNGWTLWTGTAIIDTTMTAFCNNQLGKMRIYKSMELIQMQNKQLRQRPENYQSSLPAKDSQRCAELFFRLLNILVVQRRNSKPTVLLRL